MNELMQYEEKFARLLGLKIIKKDDYYELLGSNGLVGTIREIKESEECFYITRIDANNFHFYRKRNVHDNNLDYTFYVDVDEYNRVFVDMNLGIDPMLVIYSKENDLTIFTVNNQELQLKYPTLVDNEKVLETLKIKLDIRSDLKSFLGNFYKYEALVTDERNNVKKYKQVIYPNNDGKLTIIQNMNGLDVLSSVKGCVRETLIKDDNAKDVFSRFRAYVNNLLPFKNDFLETFLEERGIKNEAFSILYEDLLDEKYFAIREINEHALIGIKLVGEEEVKSHAIIIYNLKDKYDFGHVEGFGDYAGSFEWDNDYVYRLYPNYEIDSIFDIKNRVEIKDRKLIEKLYNDYKNPKVRRINR